MACSPCFEKLIGLRNVCVPVDIKSCKWVDDVGISIHTIEQIITKGYAGPSDFFQKQYDFAVGEMVATINSHYSPKYITNTIIEGKRMGFNSQTKTLVPNTGKWVGIVVELANSNSYVDFYSPELSLFTNFTGNIPVRVYDLETAKLLDTITVASVAGEVSVIQANKLFNSKRKNMTLFFCYDSTGIDNYKTNIKNSAGCCGSAKNIWSNSYIKAYGAYSDTGGFTYDVIKKGDTTYGMSMVYSLQCNHEQWLCSNLNLLATPLVYKLASNIFLFGLNASSAERVNTLITINRDDMINSQTFYENKYRETLENVLKNMQTPDDSKCFQCKEYNRSVISLP